MRSGLSPRAMRIWAAVSGPMPQTPQQVGRGRCGERLDLRRQCGGFGVQIVPAAGEAAQAVSFGLVGVGWIARAQPRQVAGELGARCGPSHASLRASSAWISGL